MGRQFLRYGFGAIVVYLLVQNGSNTGQAFSSGASGAGKVINAFQGMKVA